MHRPLLRALAALLLFTAPLRADVLVVDAAFGPGAGFSELQNALDVVDDGDVILVRPGIYLPHPNGTLEVDRDKSFSVVADGGVVFTGDFVISGLSADKRVVLRDLSIGGSFQRGVQVLDSAGQVWIEGCSVGGESGNPFFVPDAGLPALRVGPGALVVVRDSVLTGGHGAQPISSPTPDGTSAGAAVRCEGATLLVHDSVLRGGDGGAAASDSTDALGGRGGDALQALGSQVLLTGSQLLAGQGGAATSAAPGAGGGGGDALALQGAGNLARRVDAQLVPGAGGPNGAGAASADGVELAQDAGSGVFELPGVARTLRTPGAVRELEATSLHYQGEQGDVLGLFLSPNTLALPLPFQAGTFMIGLPTLSNLGLGTVTDPAGARELAFSFPDFLPPELGGLDLFTQMVVRPSGGGLRLSNAASLQVLDGGF